MKKYLLSFAVMLTGSALLTGCLSDDNNNSGNNSQILTVTKGAYVINNGQWGKNNGGMTYMDYETLTSEQTLSGSGGLGDTPNDAVTVGDSIFIVGSSENTIFLVNKKNVHQVASQVSTTELMGDYEGYSPRHIAYYDGKLYFTTYGGYVGVIETKSFSTSTSIQKYKVGDAPEGLSFGGTNSEPYLYVANSNYGSAAYTDDAGTEHYPSISKINLTSGNVETIRNEKIRNPQELVVDGTAIYVLDWGYYTADYSQQLEAGLYLVNSNNAQLLIPNATGMGLGLVYYGSQPVGYQIVTFNNQLGNTGKPTYSMLNTYTGAITSLTLSGDAGVEIESPAAIAIDPITGNILIAARPMEDGYPSYAKSGFMNMYSNDGAYIKNTHVATGIEPHKIGFVYGTMTYTY